MWSTKQRSAAKKKRMATVWTLSPLSDMTSDGQHYSTLIGQWSNSSPTRFRHWVGWWLFIVWTPNQASQIPIQASNKASPLTSQIRLQSRPFRPQIRPLHVQIKPHWPLIRPLRTNVRPLSPKNKLLKPCICPCPPRPNHSSLVQHEASKTSKQAPQTSNQVP